MSPVSGRLGVGDEVVLDGALHVVGQVNGASVVLADVTQTYREVTVGSLLASPGFRLVGRGRGASPVPVPARGMLEGLPPDVAERARGWERHMVEVLHGSPPDAPPGTQPRPEYDPATTSLRQRETAKVAELTEAGITIALSSLQRMRRHYERDGLLGLVDGRTQRPPSSRIDGLVLISHFNIEGRPLGTSAGGDHPANCA